LVAGTYAAKTEIIILILIDSAYYLNIIYFFVANVKQVV